MVYQIRPLHISSEAPEVVPAEQSPYLTSPDKYFVRSYSVRRASNHLISPLSKHCDNIPLQEVTFPPPKRAYDLARYSPPPKQKKKIGLVPIVLIAVVSFLIGGGIGGGIGGWVGKHNPSRYFCMRHWERTKLIISVSSKTSKSESTGTFSGCAPTATEFVDSAGCPNVNNTTYTTPVPSVEFRIACAIDLTSSPGEDIELTNVTTPTLNNCLESCAQYNNGQCLAATWIQFSPNHPEMNSKCFFKANSGVRIPMNSTGTIATSGFRISWHGLNTRYEFLEYLFYSNLIARAAWKALTIRSLVVNRFCMVMAILKRCIIFTFYTTRFQRDVWGIWIFVHSLTRYEEMMENLLCLRAV